MHQLKKSPRVDQTINKSPRTIIHHLKTTWSWIGFIGLFISIGLGIFIATKVYIYPVDYFVHGPIDKIWVQLFLFSLLIVFGVFWIWQGRLLAIILLVCMAFLVAIPIIVGGLGLDFLVCLWFIITASSTGWKIISIIFKTEYLRILETLLLSTILGIGVFALISLAMGITGLYTPGWAYIILIALSILTVPAFFRHHISKINSLTQNFLSKIKSLDLRFIALTIGILIICSIGAYVWSLTPSIRWDSLSYHLAAPETYIHQKNIVEIPESYNTYWAHYAEMIYTYALLLSGQPLPGIMNFCIGIFSILLTFCLGRRFGSVRIGLMAAVIFSSIPIIGFEIGTVYNDIFVVLFSLSTIYTSLIWYRYSQPRWLILSGVFAGFALGTKIYAAIFLFPLGIFILVALFNKYKSPGNVFRFGLYFLIPTILVFSPWPIRDYLWTGNPIFPLYNQFFHSPKWYENMVNWTFTPTKKHWLEKPFQLPLSLTLNSRFHYHEGPGGMLGPIPLTSLPWLFWLPGISRTKQKMGWLASLYSIAVYFLFFSTTKNARYLMPLFPIWTYITCLNLDWVITAGSKIKHFHLKRVLLIIGVIIAIGYLLSSQLALIMRIPEYPERFPYQVALGNKTTEDFLSENLPVYEVFNYVNQVAPQSKILSLGIEYRLYTHANIYGLFFSPATRNDLKDLHNADEFGNYLKQEKFDFILVYPPAQRARPTIYSIEALNAEFFKKYLSLEFATNNIQLYRFYPEGFSRPEIKPNLLTNAGFEDNSTDKDISNWQIQGTPILISDQKDVLFGNYSVKIFGPSANNDYSYLYQEVDIHPDTIYSTGYWIKGSPGSSLQLQIEWLDENRQSIYVNYDWIAVDVNWQYFNLVSSSPSNASFARIFASVTGNGTGWIDDLCFSQHDSCLHP